MHLCVLIYYIWIYTYLISGTGAGLDVLYQRQLSCDTLCNDVINEYVEMLPE
ncbi:hypothetical protein NNRS527_01351 [Nitrosospira sp. NRS527]|nr:hypothetical protein NNRS527_01351 [Nitrosospira sp. NRS527]